MLDTKVRFNDYTIEDLINSRPTEFFNKLIEDNRTLVVLMVYNIKTRGVTKIIDNIKDTFKRFIGDQYESLDLFNSDMSIKNIETIESYIYKNLIEDEFMGAIKELYINYKGIETVIDRESGVVKPSGKYVPENFNRLLDFYNNLIGNVKELSDRIDNIFSKYDPDFRNFFSDVSEDDIIDKYRFIYNIKREKFKEHEEQK